MLQEVLRKRAELKWIWFKNMPFLRARYPPPDNLEKLVDDTRDLGIYADKSDLDRVLVRWSSNRRFNSCSLPSSLERSLWCMHPATATRSHLAHFTLLCAAPFTRASAAPAAAPSLPPLPPPPPRSGKCGRARSRWRRWRRT